MRHTLIGLARQLVIFTFSLALAIVLRPFLGIPDTSDPRFLDVSIALAASCLTLYHFRWLLGVQRIKTKAAPSINQMSRQPSSSHGQV